MQKIDCPICEKETDYLVSKRIHCNNCGNFFKIDELSSTQDKLNLIKIEENKYFKDYFQMFFTVCVILIIMLSGYYILDLILKDKISKALLYSGILFLIAPNYFKLAYKSRDSIIYTIKIIGLLLLISSFLVFTSPTFFLFK